MARDFLTSQIRTSQIIASRSLSPGPSLVIISASNADGLGSITPALGAGSDTFLFVTGSRGTNAFTVFGGSVKISGSLTVFDNTVLGQTSADTIDFSGRVGSNIVPVSSEDYDLGSPALLWDQIYAKSGSFKYVQATENAIFSSGITGSLQRVSDGSSYLIAGSNISLSTASNGSITITSTGGGGGGSSYFTDPVAGRLNTTGSLALAGNLGSSYVTNNAGSDVFFFVSGSSSTSVALFGGNIVSSGSLIIKDAAGDTDFVVTTAGVISASSNILGGGNITVAGNATVSGGLLTLTDVAGNGILEQTPAGNLELRNLTSGGDFFGSIRTTGGNTVNFLYVTSSTAASEVTVAIMPSIYPAAANPFLSSDTNFFVGGAPSSKDGATKGTAVFGGDVMISGSVYLGRTGADVVNFRSNLGSNIIPDADMSRNLGSPVRRFANVYTGDLHLRNDRGDYTIIEEEECLTIRFNKTGKRYKFVLEPAPEFD